MSWLERVRSEPPDSADTTFARQFWVASVASAETRVDTARSQLISTQANVVTEPSAYGMAYRGTSTASNTKISSGGGAATSGCYVGTTNPITVGARFKLNSTGTNQAIFSDMNSGGYDSLSISYVTSGGYIKVSVRNTGAAGYNAQIALPDPTGWHDAIVVHVPGVGLFGYLDGYLFGSQTTAGQGACTERYNSSGDPAWLANGSYAAFQNSNATLALGYILRGDYQAEAPSLTRNPWQIFAPERIWAPAAGGGTTITGALGTAVASGLTGAVNANRTLAGALGTATASGLQGVVNANRAISGALGTAVASGLVGNVNVNRTIAGALGTATASGFQGTVTNDNSTTITGSLGTAVATGFAGGVAWNRYIAGVLGVATASGFTGGVANGAAGVGRRRSSTRKIMVTIKGARFLVPEDELGTWLDGKGEEIVEQAVKPVAIVTKKARIVRPNTLPVPKVATAADDAWVKSAIAALNERVQRRIVQDRQRAQEQDDEDVFLLLL